jgi:hypothetical protein
MVAAGSRADWAAVDWCRSLTSRAIPVCPSLEEQRRSPQAVPFRVPGHRCPSLGSWRLPQQWSRRRARMSALLHLALALALSRALISFGRWLVQRQAQQAAQRILQARPGRTAVFVRADGAIEVRWDPNDAAGIKELEALPPSPLAQPKALPRADRPLDGSVGT